MDLNFSGWQIFSQCELQFFNALIRQLFGLSAVAPDDKAVEVILITECDVFQARVNGIRHRSVLCRVMLKMNTGKSHFKLALDQPVDFGILRVESRRNKQKQYYRSDECPHTFIW